MLGFTREALLKPFQRYDGLCSKEDCASFQKQDHHFESHVGPYFHTYFNLLLVCSRFVAKLRLASFGRCDLFVIKSRWKPFPFSALALVINLSRLFTTSVCPFVYRVNKKSPKQPETQQRENSNSNNENMQLEQNYAL